MAMTPRNYTIARGGDTFEIKRKQSITKAEGAGEVRIFFAESELTAYEARKLSDWLLRAAEYCDKENGK